MSLAPGTRIGPYEVAGPLGAGGLEESSGLTALVMELVEGEAVAFDLPVPLDATHMIV